MFHHELRTIHRIAVQIFCHSAVLIKRESKNSQIINTKHIKDFISRLAHYVNLLVSNIMSKAMSGESNSKDLANRNNDFLTSERGFRELVDCYENYCS